MKLKPEWGEQDSFTTVLFVRPLALRSRPQMLWEVLGLVVLLVALYVLLKVCAGFELHPAGDLDHLATCFQREWGRMRIWDASMDRRRASICEKAQGLSRRSQISPWRCIPRAHVGIQVSVHLLP